MQPLEYRGVTRELQGRAATNGVNQREYVRRVIRLALLSRDPLINSADAFAVMGFDWHEGHFFPCGSAPTINQARLIAKQKIAKEPRYNPASIDDGWEHIGCSANSFQIFTMDGEIVPLEEPELG